MTPRYTYAWGNNDRRSALKGRPCVIEATGALGSVLVAFVDTGERIVTSRRALRHTATAQAVAPKDDSLTASQSEGV